MQRWEYCEIEVVYKRPGTETTMYILKPDGSHEQSSGRYGEMMAALGEQGWELVSAMGVRTLGDPLLKMFFKREIAE